MNSRGTADFWRRYWALPPRIRLAAGDAYRRFLLNPAHPSLRLERLRADRRFWSVRVTLDYRAVAFRSGDLWVWTWIGNHEEFDAKFPC